MHEKPNLIRLIGRIDTFPPLPAVVTQVLQITADPNSSIRDLVKVIEADVALASGILKIANSPFCGLSRQVQSLSHALGLLGTSEVRTMVLAKIMFNTFMAVSQDKLKKMHSLFRHAFNCGLVAKTMATRFGLDKNESFIAGLVHDIGKLVICLEFREELLKISSSEAPSDPKDLRREKQLLLYILLMSPFLSTLKSIGGGIVGIRKSMDVSLISPVLFLSNFQN